MDELDDLLRELTPTTTTTTAKPTAQAVVKPAPTPVAAAPVRMTSYAPAPAAHSSSVNFSDLDDLMEELSRPKTAKVNPPLPIQSVSPAAATPVVLPPAPMPAPVYNHAPPAAAPVHVNHTVAEPAPKVHEKSAAVEDLLAELQAVERRPANGPGTGPSNHGPMTSPPTQKSANSSARKAPAGVAAGQLDSLLTELQGLSTRASVSAPPPKSEPSDPVSKLDELENLLSSATLAPTKKPAHDHGSARSISAFAAPTGPERGICAFCKNTIVGQVTTAIGKTWHPDHFCCMTCRKPLTTGTFFEKDGMPYCERDFNELFSARCAYCDGIIEGGQAVSALGKTWHFDHFFCSQCGKKFASGGFMEHDGKAYCEEDYYNMFAPKCGRCDKSIMAECISALNQKWHVACFFCDQCKQSFGSGSFFEHEGRPYCETHYYQQKGSLCATCQKPILGRCMVALNQRFHPEHFVCEFCKKQLSHGAFKEQGSKPYCVPCHIKLFG